MDHKVYLDYAATAPADPIVVKAMEPFFFENFGNASSPHSFGQIARKAMEDAREQLSQLINAPAAEIVFTSGATESNNQAIFGVAGKLEAKGRHIIVSAIEHHSVLEPVEWLQRKGHRVSYIPVDAYGRVDAQQIRDAITDETILIAVMMASNEIGTIQPAAEIGAIARERGIPFLVDAVQAVGHIPVDVQTMQCDLLSLSAHKFYGPKGVGALYIRKGTPMMKYLYGGDQERERRASTQNVAGIVGMGKAVELCQLHMTSEVEQQTRLRRRIQDAVLRDIPGSRLNGDPDQRLPNNAHFSFEGIEGESLLMSLDMSGIATSMGSACTSGALEPSHVLRAIGLSDDLALGSLRVTIGRWTTEEEVNYFLSQLKDKVAQLRV